MLKMLLCCEGKTDHGYDTYHGGNVSHTDGVVQVFLQKLVCEETFCFVVRKRGDIKRFALIPNPNKFAPRNLVTGRKLAAIAQKEECVCIAYHRDEDNNGFENVYSQVNGYFSVAEERGIPCLAIVPMHMTESWLLSDANAFPAFPSDPELPRKPEEVWGKPDSDLHPKKYIRRVLSQFHRQPSTDTFSEIADKSDIEVVRERCPVSFGKFCDDINSLFPGRNGNKEDID